MIIQPQLPNGYVIFCDDVREEVNGKLTLVGTYGGEMTLFGANPALLPKLCATIRFRISPDLLPNKFVFRVSKDAMGKSDTLFEAPVDAPVLPDEFEFPEPFAREGMRILEVGINAILQGILFTEPAVIRVKVLVGDDEYRVGALSVKLAPLPGAEPA